MNHLGFRGPYEKSRSGVGKLQVEDDLHNHWFTVINSEVDGCMALRHRCVVDVHHELLVSADKSLFVDKSDFFFSVVEEVIVGMSASCC